MKHIDPLNSVSDQPTVRAQILSELLDSLRPPGNIFFSEMILFRESPRLNVRGAGPSRVNSRSPRPKTWTAP